MVFLWQQCQICCTLHSIFHSLLLSNWLSIEVRFEFTAHSILQCDNTAFKLVCDMGEISNLLHTHAAQRFHGLWFFHVSLFQNCFFSLSSSLFLFSLKFKVPCHRHSPFLQISGIIFNYTLIFLFYWFSLLFHRNPNLYLVWFFFVGLCLWLLLRAFLMVIERKFYIERALLHFPRLHPPFWIRFWTSFPRVPTRKLVKSFVSTHPRTDLRGKFSCVTEVMS